MRSTEGELTEVKTTSDPMGARPIPVTNSPFGRAGNTVGSGAGVTPERDAPRVLARATSSRQLWGQVLRYENKNVQPPANVLSKLADLFGTTVDVLVNGNAPDKAQAALKNAELLKHFRQLEELPEDDLKMFVKLIGAYLRDHKAKQAYA